MNDDDSNDSIGSGECAGPLCQGDCPCYERGCDDGREEEAWNSTEESNQEMADAFVVAIEAIFSEELRAVEGKEIFAKDPQAARDSMVLHRVLDKLRRCF
jgi:hypothetical protein